MSGINTLCFHASLVCPYCNLDRIQCGTDAIDWAMDIQQCEANISEGFSSSAAALYQIGKNLARIKDEKLYRAEGYQSFNDYMEDRWDMKRNQGYNLIYAAGILDELREHFQPHQLPQTESAIRPLRSIPEERRVEVWQEALNRARSSHRPPGKGLVDSVIADLDA